MLQECNKFREHQAREILIELLEKQLKSRQDVLKDLKEELNKADEILGDSVRKEPHETETE